MVQMKFGAELRQGLDMGKEDWFVVMVVWTFLDNACSCKVCGGDIKIITIHLIFIEDSGKSIIYIYIPLLLYKISSLYI